MGNDIKKTKINILYKDTGNTYYFEKSNKNMMLETYLSDILKTEDMYSGNNTMQFDALLSGSNRVLFFIGYKQTGKSMFLKQYFNIKNASPFIDHSKNRLVLPIVESEELKDKSPLDIVEEGIKGLYDRLCSEFPYTEELFSDKGIDEFYQFILDTRARLLPELSFSEESKLTSKDRKYARIDKMQERHKLDYQVLRLKFCLNRYCESLRNLVIVVDDIQDFFTGENRNKDQIKMVELFFDIFKSMEDDISIKGEKLRFFLVIATRPRDYRLIMTENQIAEYSPVRIWNENKLNSAELFNRVVERDVKIAGDEKVVEVESERAYPDASDFGLLLSSLSQKFGRKYSTMIEKLCFYNTGLIMQAYKRILLNTTWVREGGFKFTSSEEQGEGIAFNNITCIRALACGNEKVYKRQRSPKEMDDIDNLIPNILYNEENEDGDYRLLNLYTMKYFLRHLDPQKEWGENYVILGAYVDRVCSLLNVNINTCIFSVNYLFERDVLRRSVYDVESAAGEKYNKELGSENLLYITSRGTQLWDMLRSDSVLLELYREDMYMDESLLVEGNEKSSYDLMIEGMQGRLFSFLLDIIENVFKSELKFYSTACVKGKSAEYREAFGKQPISLVLLEGVTKSIQYSGWHGVMKRRNDIEAKMLSEWNQWGS